MGGDNWLARVTLVMGRAKSGKSTWIANKIADQLRQTPLGTKIYWLVPGNASYETERLLLSRSKTSLRAEVLTLRRLAYRMNEELQVIPGTAVNTTGQRLLLGSVLDQIGEKLQLLYRVHPSLSFLDAVLRVFGEMSDYLIEPQQLSAALWSAATVVDELDIPSDAVSGHSLLGKLHDLSLLFVNYQSELTQRNLYDPNTLLARLAPFVRQWSQLQHATIYLDGFPDLSPQELSFLLSLAEVASETVVAVSADPAWFVESTATASVHTSDVKDTSRLTRWMTSPDKMAEVYALQTVEMVHRIQTGCRLMEIALSEISLMEKNNAAFNTSIAWLEQHLFSRSSNSVMPWQAGLALVAAQNPRIEVEGVAREIAHLIRDESWHPGDIAVLTPSLSEYGGFLRDAFDGHEVPAFIEDYPPLAVHPLSRFLLAALTCLEEEMSDESAVRLLKSDFCTLTREEADWLETYLRRWEISGIKPWRSREPWQFSKRGGALRNEALAEMEDGRAEGLRWKLMGFLLPLWEDLPRGDVSPRQFSQAIWNLLESVGARRVVAGWIVNDGAVDNPLAAGLHEQAWQRLVGILNDLAETVPDIVLPRAALVEAMRNDLVQQTLTTVPAGIDEVLVTEIERAGALHRRGVFVVGLVDGVLPRRIRPTGLLTDEERTQFARLFGRDLGYLSADLQWMERLRVYTALTRAEQRLYLTYPLADANGKASRPAAVVQQVRNLFNPVMAEQGLDLLWTGDKGLPEPRHWTPAAALLRWSDVLRHFAEGVPFPTWVVPVLDWFLQHPHYHPLLQHTLEGLGHHQRRAGVLSNEVIKSIYGDPLKLNVHQLETFAACPFRHFVQFGLRIREEAVPDVTASGRGSLIHETLREFVELQKQDSDRWKTITDNEAAQLMSGVFAEVLRQPQASPWLRLHTRQQVIFAASEILQRAAVVLARHARYGDFIPAALEVSFGMDNPNELPGWEIFLEDGTQVVIRGRMDRVDWVRREGDLAFRILDYKSSRTDLELYRVYYGLRLQLPVYMGAVIDFAERLFGQRAQPVGMLYFPLVRKNQFVPQPLAVNVAYEQSLRSMRVRGWLLGEERWLEAMDGRLSSGEDGLFPKIYKKDGNFASTAPVLNSNQWQGLLAMARKKVVDLAQSLKNGQITVAPYVLSNTDYACRFCNFAAICQIDQRWDKTPVQRLRPLSKEEVLRYAVALQSNKSFKQEAGAHDASK
ncbi:hypothetical protein D2Q93_02340 [Alicyclobacillaceae bacterium I2511]|nr:hypothetical protein D2Q93_02340 [Alicyclobacillaceae bacterium I2511]